MSTKIRVSTVKNTCCQKSSNHTEFLDGLWGWRTTIYIKRRLRIEWALELNNSMQKIVRSECCYHETS